MCKGLGPITLLLNSDNISHALARRPTKLGGECFASKLGGEIIVQVAYQLAPYVVRL